MNRKIQITRMDSAIRLRTARVEDLENLRVWKNNCRTSFFYQKVIQPEQQKQWFDGYLKRDDDYMFIIEEGGARDEQMAYHPFGCMAFRVTDDSTIDLYNIIRGENSLGQASMRTAMYMMLNYIVNYFPNKKIKCDVLKDNEAVKWYQKCGFAIWQEKEYYIMGINKEDIPMIKIEVREE